MKEEDYQELLNRATALMDERLASIPPTALPGNISIRGRTLSYDAGLTTAPVEDEFNSYTGDLQVSPRHVRVVPFGVYVSGVDYFMVPNIRGRSIFGSNPPTLNRRPGGAAVYIESEFRIYDRGTPSTAVDDIPYRARLVACNIVDRALGTAYPIEKATLSVSVPSGAWNLVTSSAKSYRLLGVYNADGRVYNQTYLYGSPWKYRDTTLEDGRVIPPGRPAATVAPIKFEVTFDYPHEDEDPR